MRVFGAIILAFAGSYIGITKAREIKKRAATLRAVCAMLEMMRGEICSRRTPMDELFALLSSNASTQVSSFCREMLKKLNRLSDSSFATLWANTVKDELNILPEHCIGALCELGGSLGRYDAELQASAIDRALCDLNATLAEAQAKLKEEGKMYIALGSGLGIILAVVLI